MRRPSSTSAPSRGRSDHERASRAGYTGEQRAGPSGAAALPPRARIMTSATTSDVATREHEFKFLVPDDFEMPGLDDVVARSGDTVVEQTATYYDTVDLRLA